MKNKSTQTISKKSALWKASTITLILAIIGTVGTAFMTILPATPALVGILLFIALVFVILLCSVFTLFLIWMAQGFRDFIVKFWGVVAACFTGADKVMETIRTIFPYLAIVCGILVVAGFTVNLIAYLKHKESKKLKGRFIATSIMLGASAVLIIVAALLVYLIK